jgi:hypothetical protein
MSHWAEIDENNIVTRVTVGDNNDPNGDEGYQWLIDNLGGTWIKTSYSGNIRKNYAGIGYFYDQNRDAFIAPKEFESWTLNEDTCKWMPPKPQPNDGWVYYWNEENLDWENQNFKVGDFLEGEQ